MRPCCYAFSIFVLVSTLSSCLRSANKEQNESDIELVSISINNDYSIGIPGYMMKTKSLNEEASLQFQNLFKDVYVIGIDENKQEFIDAYKKIESYDTTRSPLSNYADIQMQSTTANMNVLARKDITRLTINGLNAETTEIDAKIEGVKIPLTYFLTFIEGDEKLYMIMAWTAQKDKDTYRSTFVKMAKSFKMIYKRRLLPNDKQ